MGFPEAAMLQGQPAGCFTFYNFFEDMTLNTATMITFEALNNDCMS